jgi:flagellar biosynthesis protein FlhF
VPIEVFNGPRLPELLAAANRSLGPDAYVLQVRRKDGGFELVVCDRASIPAKRILTSDSCGARPLSPPRKQVPYQTHFQGRILAIVGPTGSGKTTTLAKLATHPLVFGAKNVGLLGLDTYRVGAVEQLRTYAEIAQLACEIVYDDADLERALKRLASCRVVLVDTPGRGPARQEDQETVRRWLKRIRPDEIHLALPAVLQPSLARHLLSAYRALGITHVLPTKLDENPRDTTAFDAAVAAGLPVRWCTNGQDVPNHLRPAGRLYGQALERSGSQLQSREQVA